MPAMPTEVLVALIVFLLVSACAVAYAAQQGLRAWKAFKRLRRNLDGLTVELSKGLTRLEARSNELPAKQARLDAARVSLERSLGELRVLLHGANEVAALVQAVRALMPSR
jgi:hypothetical protein